MLMETDYCAMKAVEYAKKWALQRNPAYFNLDKLGGDCTNFISQCLLEGCGVMNFQKDTGWYYINPHNRSPAWTSVKHLYKFLINNKGAGPFGMIMPIYELSLGDLIQLGHQDDQFYHTLMVTGLEEDNIFLSAHSRDVHYKSLHHYTYEQVRGIHLLGVRKPLSDR